MLSMFENLFPLSIHVLYFSGANVPVWRDLHDRRGEPDRLSRHLVRSKPPKIRMRLRTDFPNIRHH